MAGSSDLCGFYQMPKEVVAVMGPFCLQPSWSPYVWLRTFIPVVLPLITTLHLASLVTASRCRQRAQLAAGSRYHLPCARLLKPRSHCGGPLSGEPLTSLFCLHPSSPRLLSAQGPLPSGAPRGDAGLRVLREWVSRPAHAGSHSRLSLTVSSFSLRL